MVFGALWLWEVRKAREQTLGPWAARRGGELFFPLWKVPGPALLGKLFGSGVEVRESAILSSREWLPATVSIEIWW